jgi:hypothetical protein
MHKEPNAHIYMNPFKTNGQSISIQLSKPNEWELRHPKEGRFLSLIAMTTRFPLHLLLFWVQQHSRKRSALGELLHLGAC